MEGFPTTIADIMSSLVITVDLETIVRDVSLLMNEKRIGSIIITKLGEAVGIATERDLLLKIVSRCNDPCKTKVKEIMTTPIITTTKDVNILEAARIMRKNNIRRLVVKEKNILQGIVTDKDILRAVSISALTSFSNLLGRN